MGKDGTSLTDQNILITDNFGIQKWVYVVISSDNTIVDAYIDGKLVNSTKLQTAPNQPATAKKRLLYMDKIGIVMLLDFKSWNKPIGPQEVWDNYMAGNSNAISQFFGSYSFTFGVNKDNVQQSSYTIGL